jgi:hypothetical protein
MEERMTKTVTAIEWRNNRLIRIAVLDEAIAYLTPSTEQEDLKVLSELVSKRDRFREEYNDFVEQDMENHGASPYQLWVILEHEPEPEPEPFEMSLPSSKEPRSVN